MSYRAPDHLLAQPFIQMQGLRGQSWIAMANSSGWTWQREQVQSVVVTVYHLSSFLHCKELRSFGVLAMSLWVKRLQ